jgi:hypothetical protein
MDSEGAYSSTASSRVAVILARRVLGTIHFADGYNEGEQGEWVGGINNPCSR